MLILCISIPILQLALTAIPLSQAGTAISNVAEHGSRGALQRRNSPPPDEQGIVGPTITKGTEKWQGLTGETRSQHYEELSARQRAADGSMKALPV